MVERSGLRHLLDEPKTPWRASAIERCRIRGDSLGATSAEASPVSAGFFAFAVGRAC
ncbi:hypothetical protein [Burkholderia latens]|uniref:hypothetical protein n=1 Tax=Burkholderia latens TaxID=488446 RepID=UPI00158B7076|nr:hypothetical protein [Burkholderia latens]